MFLLCSHWCIFYFFPLLFYKFLSEKIKAFISVLFPCSQLKKNVFHIFFSNNKYKLQYMMRLCRTQRKCCFPNNVLPVDSHPPRPPPPLPRPPHCQKWGRIKLFCLRHGSYCQQNARTVQNRLHHITLYTSGAALSTIARTVKELAASHKSVFIRGRTVNK